MPKIIDSILRDYPYPIAKCYERLVGTHELQDRWNLVRYLLEVTLKYGASLAVSRYIYNRESDAKIDSALACLTRPSMGHWSNLLIRCAQYNQSLDRSYIPEATFAPVKTSMALLKAHRAMQCFSSGKDSGLAKHLTITRFFETFVAYRNRTSGHGSPSQSHIEEITPVLEEAISDLLLQLDVLKDIHLMYVSEIHLDRQSYVHELISLKGTSPVALENYETEVDKALVGHNKQLFLTEIGGDAPVVSLHPLAMFSDGEVYLLHRSDLKRNVEYICHNTGKFYAGDRIFEDFKETFGSVLGQTEERLQKYQPEDIYEESVRMSLIDGVFSTAEEQYLLELRDQLEISTMTANEIEERVRRELKIDNRSQANTVSVSKNVELEAVSRNLKKGETPERILFLSYASVRTGFWADLVSRLASTAHQKGYVFSMVTPPHTGDYDVSYTASLVAEMDRIIGMHQPDLLLLVPFPSESFSSLFRSRFRDINLPIVTLDTEIIDTGPFNDTDYIAPPMVQVDNYEGGKLIAELMLDKMGSMQDSARFLIMPGLSDASHSKSRIEGFKDQLRESAPDAITRVLPEGAFNRKKARNVFEDFLCDVELSRYNGIFCCNDEMALGVYEAVNLKLGDQTPEKPFIIGAFNNTVEFNAVMAADHRGLLVGSVDQNLDEYVSAVFSTITRIFMNGEVESRVLIPPRIL